MAKILLFDIETFTIDPFQADKGFILCACWKWLGEKEVYTSRYLAPQNDRPVCRELLAAITEADMLVSWNGKSFDLRFLQTRLLKHRMGYLPPVPHEDGLLTARRTLKMRRSLNNIADFFELKRQKHTVPFSRWLDAALGDKYWYEQIVKHCQQDVRVLEDAYRLIGPMSKVHPNVSGKEGACPFCGSLKLQHRGRVGALRHYRKRYQCRCGRWSSSAPIKYGA